MTFEGGSVLMANVNYHCMCYLFTPTTAIGSILSMAFAVVL